MMMGTETPRPDDWHHTARCLPWGPDLFVPPPPKTIGDDYAESTKRLIAQAKEVCKECPHGAACEAEGYRLGDTLSIRNGKLPSERELPQTGACGTLRGFRRHEAAGGTICEACRQAYNEDRAAYARARTVARQKAALEAVAS